MKSITALYQRPSLTGIIALGWLSITTVFFATQNSSVQIPPIAEGALSSLLLAYFPVLLLCVFLLLFLDFSFAARPFLAYAKCSFLMCILLGF